MKVFIDPAFHNYYERFPLVLVDIGARGGLQTNWKRAREYLQVIGFEPDQHEFDKLTRSMSSNAVKYLNTALYKDRRSLDFYLTRERGTSSILRPNRRFLNRFPKSESYDVLKTVQLETDSLDNQIQKHQIKDVDFIKLDTQGSELFILEGAKKLITDHVFGLEIEVEFTEIYKDQPLFSDIDCFVRKFGFHLFDLKPHYWKSESGKSYGGPKGQIIFADALYLKSAEGIVNVLGQIQLQDLRKAKALKFLSVCILYGYLDYALELIETTEGLFTTDEMELIVREFKRQVHFSRRIPNFPGRGKIAQGLYSLYSMVRRSYEGWATSGRTLGNLE